MSSQMWSHDHADGQRHSHLVGQVCTDGAMSSTDVGRVDFREMLTTDGHWSLRDRLETVLGRPYLATQLAALLPSDVCHRLAERLDHLVEERVRLEVDKIHADISRATTETIVRLAQSADEKLEELRRERFGRPSRLG